jgi:trans-2,3-dihydro-3-hydroxyanthranilate isomerase
LRHLIVPLADGGALREITLDGTRIVALAERALLDTVCVWAAGSDRNHFRLRDLCAAIGAIEEPASGTTSGALAFYLAQHEQLASQELVVEQGVEMGRPSRIEVVLTLSDRVTVRGGARKVVEGTLVLPSAMPG